MAALFVFAIGSAILSTIDSAILAPSTLLAENIASHVRPAERISPLKRNRLAVAIIGALSAVVAFAGEDTYTLLEEAYEIGFVTLFVPFAWGVLRTPRNETSALVAMSVGAILWGIHRLLGWETFAGPLAGGLSLSNALPIVGCAALAYRFSGRTVGANEMQTPADRATHRNHEKRE